MAKVKVTNNVGTTFSTEDIVKAMSEKSKVAGSEFQLTQKQAADSLSLFKEAVQDALATGQKVQLTGFITIEPSYRSPRKGNNVVTGEPMDIPESVALNVKAGKSLKDTAKELDASIVKSLKASKDKKDKKDK